MMSTLKEIREKLDIFEKEEFTVKDFESCRESIYRMRNQANWALRELREAVNVIERHDQFLWRLRDWKLACKKKGTLEEMRVLMRVLEISADMKLSDMKDNFS